MIRMCATRQISHSRLCTVADMAPGLSVISFESRIQDTSPTLLSDRLSSSFPPYPRDGSASLGTWHARTLNRIITGSLGRCSDRPVIAGDLVDGLVPAGWGRLILVYSQSTSGSTRPGERPVTARSGDVSSTRQHSIMGHANEEEIQHSI